MTFETMLRQARAALAGRIESLRDVALRRGGRLLPRMTIEAARDAVADEAARRLGDRGLVEAFAERPDLLDLDERLRADGRDPRGVLRAALAAALADRMGDIAVAALCDGQDEDTLAEAASAAIAALDATLAAGSAYPLDRQARAHLAGDEWEDPAVRALATHLAAFLEERGYGGVADDLRAALDGRDAVPPPCPRPR